MDPILLTDTILRLLAVGQLVLIALVVWRGSAPRPLRWVTAGLLVSIAAYLGNATPVFNARTLTLWPVIQIAAQSAPILLWVFAHMLFERRMPRWILIVAVVVTIACWANFMVARYGTHHPPVLADHIQLGVSFLLLAHTIWIALVAWNDDLVERRRRFRAGFVLLVGVQALAVIIGESLWSDAPVPWLMLVQSGAALLAVMALGVVLLSSNSDLLFDGSTPVPNPAPTLSPAENVLKQRLDAAMGAGVYRETGLTIGALADRLAVPEHRLRALINQRLGYRNFSDYLNRHRLADAKAWLADPDKVALPVLTIAMDLGYGSLAPFNRAFRDATQQTPSEWRRAALGAP